MFEVGISRYMLVEKAKSILVLYLRRVGYLIPISTVNMHGAMLGLMEFLQ